MERVTVEEVLKMYEQGGGRSSLLRTERSESRNKMPEWKQKEQQRKRNKEKIA